jgi:AcrR family transcriptional regulator
MKAAPAKKTRRVQGDALRESREREILKCAAKLFATYGYAGTDTQLLADHLNVGKGTLYRYFKNKESLFLAVADNAMVEVRDWVDAHIKGIEDPLERLATAIRAYLTFVSEHPEFVELLIQERAQFKDRRKPTFFVHREANIQRWKNLYQGLIGEGRIRTMPVERITEVMSQLLYGTIFINYFTGQNKSPAAQAEDIVDIVFHGILSEKERQSGHAKSRG